MYSAARIGAVTAIAIVISLLRMYPTLGKSKPTFPRLQRRP
jgi:hypothetical protein